MRREENKKMEGSIKAGFWIALSIEIIGIIVIIIIAVYVSLKYKPNLDNSSY